LCAFGDPWHPENTGFSLAKTRGTVSAFDIIWFYYLSFCAKRLIYSRYFGFID